MSFYVYENISIFDLGAAHCHFNVGANKEKKYVQKSHQKSKWWEKSVKLIAPNNSENVDWR